MVKLGEVCELIGGYAFKSDLFIQNKIPVIRIGNITNNGVIVDNKICYDESFWNTNKRFRILKNDILMAMSGATIGKLAINKSDEKMLINQRVLCLRPLDNVNGFYIFYVMSSDSFKKYILEIANGCAQPNISAEQTSKFTVLLPPLEEQERIVDELDKINELIAKRKMQIEKLDLLIKSKFTEMFGDPVTNPKRWENSTIGESCFSVKDGPHVSPKYVLSGIPFISVRNIVNGKICFEDAKYITEEDYYEYTKKSKPEKGDLLYSKGGTTGIAKVIDTDVVFCNWVHLAVLKFEKNILNPIFFENMLNSSYCYQQSQQLTKGIANRDLVLSAMKQIKIIVPNLILQTQFAEFVEKVEQTKEQMQKGLEQLETLYKQRMQEYFE